MISSIPITNDFTQIDAEYKIFKQNIFKRWCDASEISIQFEEKKIINSIESIIKDIQTNQNREDNVIRALIGIKTLSKYTILNQDKCVQFFAIIGANLPILIPKRRFFFKCIAKISNSKSNFVWDKYLNSFFKKFLPMRQKQPSMVDSIEDTLIYIHFLIQYAPNFVCKNSIEIFLHLFQIIQKADYILDLNYDIISYTNFTIDTYFDVAPANVNKYYANYAIELLRSIFERIKSVRYQMININIILKWNQYIREKPDNITIKILAVLAVLFENIDKTFLQKNLKEIYNFLINIEDDREDVQCLKTRNFIYYLLIANDINNIELFADIFSFETDSTNVICGKLQNIELLINKNHKIIDNVENMQKIIRIIIDCLNSKENFVRENAFELLNRCCLYNKEEHNNYFEFDTNFIQSLYQQNFHFQFIEIMKIIMNEEKLFYKALMTSLDNEPYKTLHFLYEIMNDKEEVETNAFNSFFSYISKNDQIELIQKIFNLIDNNDPDVGAFAPLVAVQIEPLKLFSNPYLKKLFHRLLVSQSDDFKLNILQCFNDHLTNENIKTYTELHDKLSDQSASRIFSFLLNEYLSHKIHIETVKLVCKLSKFDDLNFFPIVKPFLIYFTSFSNDNENVLPNYENYFVFHRKLANIAEFLPYIFDSFPNCYSTYFDSFYNFSLDFMRDKANIKSHSKLSTPKKILLMKTYFQQIFYKKTFYYYVKTLIIVIKNNQNYTKPYLEDIINFCSDLLQNKIGEAETQYTLNLLEESIQSIGLDKVQNVNDLFTIVFNTACHFTSKKIYLHAFKILGFLGAQLPYEKTLPIYDDNDDKTILLTSKLINFAEYNIVDNLDEIYYELCSKHLFQILDDESLQHSHFYALESLIYLFASIKSNIINENHFLLLLQYFDKLLGKSGDNDRAKFVSLFESMLKINIRLIENSTSKMVNLLIKLWRYGSFNICNSFINTFEMRLIPFLSILIPSIRSLDNTETVIDLLINIYKKCNTYSVSYNCFNLDVIEIIIEMISKGNYQIISKFISLIPKIENLETYTPLIIKTCINLIDKENNDNKNLMKIIDLLCTLASQNNSITKSIFNKFCPSIIKALQRFPEQLDDFNNFLYMNSNVIVNNPNISNSQIRIPSKRFNITPVEVFQIDQFVDLITSIDDYIESETKSIYIQQWLDELILFCIENSPNSIIKTVFSVAKNNILFAHSIFNIAFHSFIVEIESCKSPLNRKTKISMTFLNVLKSENAPHDCKVIIIDLIDFLDRLRLPLFDPNLCPELLTSVFSNKPPLLLRYSLVNFENKLSNSKNQLLHAFLNTGSLDQYQEFSRIFGITNNKMNSQLPILAGYFEDRNHLEIANSYFNDLQKNECAWDFFNNEIDRIKLKVITHIFRAAALIQKYWTSKDKINLKNEILDEIDLGFDALSNEGGPHFSQGFTSVLQSIIYGQQLTELKELFLSNGKTSNFHLRMHNTNQLFSFLTPILLLRTSAKGTNQDSLNEKVELLSLCRQSKRWEMMKFYKEFFGFDDEYAPIEVQYEIIHYKMANNLASKSDFDSLLSKIQAKNGDSELKNNVKHQLALYYSRLPNNENNKERFKDIISICGEIDEEGFANDDLFNLWGWANLQLFQIELNSNKESLNEAIKFYIKGALMNEKDRISNTLLIISLLFTYYNNSQDKIDIKSIQGELNKIPLSYYLDVISQMISYVPDLKENTFKEFIIELLSDLLFYFPEGVIYDYSFSLFSDNRTENGILINSPIKEIKDKFENNEKVKKLFEEVESLTNNLAFAMRDFFYSAYQFLRFSLNFVAKQKMSKTYNIKLFIHNEIEPFINNYIQPIHKLFQMIPNSYEFTNAESFLFGSFNKNDFYSLKSLVENINENLEFLYQLQNEVKELQDRKKEGEQVEDDLNIKMTKIAEITSPQNLSNLFEKIKNSTIKINSLLDVRLQATYCKDRDLFKLSPKLEKTRNLSLPVFATYQWKYDNNGQCSQNFKTIQKFYPECSLFSSLKSPKKISILASDGHKYSFILKNTEDLRTDQRIMLFNKFINQFIQTKIKTYSIVPLTSKFGIIQYVNETVDLTLLMKPLRNESSINISLYLQDNLFQNRIDNFGLMTRVQHLEFYRNLIQIEPETSLKESFWFFTPDSEKWFKFTNNYVKTYAASAIVGYIIGLGDRHLGNIMISKSDGSIMHIDFCDVFEIDQIKANSPELFPFRLTRNLVAAFGPCREKGTFRIICEETMTIMRENRQIIRNLLKVFVDSPIRNTNFSQSLVTSNSDISDIKSRCSEIMKRIDKKLNGTDVYVLKGLDNDEESAVQLSVGDHVQKLFDCATDEYNLAAAYIGYLSWA